MKLRNVIVLAGALTGAAHAESARAQADARPVSPAGEGPAEPSANKAPGGTASGAAGGAVSAPAGGAASAGGASAASKAAVPSLARVMQLAREHAPIVAVAKASVDVGRAALVGARLGPVGNPVAQVLVDHGTQNATRDLAVQGALALPIEVSGQRERREAEARALVDWQAAELMSVRASAVADAVRAYGQLVVADARIRALTELSEVARAEATYYSARVEAGDATVLDAKLSELELAKHVVALAEGRADRSRALGAVGMATGATYTDAPEGGPHPPAPRAAAPSAGSTSTATSASTSSPTATSTSTSASTSANAGVEAPVGKEAADLATAPGDGAAGPTAKVADGAGPRMAEIPAVRASDAQALFHAKEKERAAIEAHSPLSLVLTVGRGDLGELRVGGGLAWSLPVLRSNQGEQARAEASRAKAVVEREQKRRTAEIAKDALLRERTAVRQAIDAVTSVAEPAAQAAVDAAVATEQAGKGDLLRVLTARRDLALLKGRRLELLQREWNLVSDLVALTGELP